MSVIGNYSLQLKYTPFFLASLHAATAILWKRGMICDMHCLGPGNPEQLASLARRLKKQSSLWLVELCFFLADRQVSEVMNAPFAIPGPSSDTP